MSWLKEFGKFIKSIVNAIKKALGVEVKERKPLTPEEIDAIKDKLDGRFGGPGVSRPPQYFDEDPTDGAPSDTEPK